MHYVRPVTRQHQICSYADAMDDAKKSGVRATVSKTTPVENFDDLLGGGEMRRIGYVFYCPSTNGWEAYFCAGSTRTDRAIILGVVATYQAAGTTPTVADRSQGWHPSGKWRGGREYLHQQLVRPVSDLSDEELDVIELALSVSLAVPNDLSSLHELASGGGA